jgi:hypothetical protein
MRKRDEVVVKVVGFHRLVEYPGLLLSFLGGGLSADDAAFLSQYNFLLCCQLFCCQYSMLKGWRVWGIGWG